MSARYKKRGIRGLGIGLTATVLALMAVGTASAGSGNPSTIGVSPTTGLSVSASGTWAWEEMATASTLSYAGFAIDWGDVTSGNALGAYHIGDGTSATNLVLQPTTPAQGSSGAWGPVSHTYAASGTYTVCVIIYDMGETKPFKTSGYHSTKASGTSRNSDNSVDNKMNPPAACTQVDVGTVTTASSPLPFESFQGETSDPSPFESFQGITSPPTSTGSNLPGDNGGSPLLPLSLLLACGLASVVTLRAIKANR